MIDSAGWNEAISKLADDEEGRFESPASISGSGKTIPYLGWWWRDVNFNSRLVLGYCRPSSGFDASKGFVGFMQRNKWGYPKFKLSLEEDGLVKDALEDIIAEPTQDKLNAFSDLLNGLWPRPTPAEG